MALFEFTGFDWRIAFTAVTVLILIAAEVYALLIPQGKKFWWVALITAALIVASLWISGAVVKTVLLDLAALVLVFLVWGQEKTAGKLFLTAVVLGSILVAVGMALGGMFGEGAAQPEGLSARIVTALVLIGFMIKLAAIPFSFWLPSVAEKSSVMTAVLVISMLDMAEFGELTSLRIEAPWLFINMQWIWIALALASMFAGALLALAQTNIRRMLAFSTIDDIGYLILGLAAGTTGGVLGAAIGALSHSLCKFLLFGAVGVAENGQKHPLTLSERGLGGKYRVACAAFIAGSLGMIGVPPLMGFLGRWRLYYSGLEVGGVGLAIAMAAATALALLYYFRVIHKVWLGQAAEDAAVTPSNFFWIDFILVIFVVLLILAGLFPAILPGLGGR
jgi:multicomponent Na+:H+ antiporter subunit D